MPPKNFIVIPDSCSRGPAQTLLSWCNGSMIIGIWRSVYRFGPIGVLDLPNFDNYIQYSDHHLLMRRMASGKWEKLVLKEVKGDKKYMWCHLGYGPIDGGPRRDFLFYLQEEDRSIVIEKSPLKCGRECRPVFEEVGETKDVVALR